MLRGAAVVGSASGGRVVVKQRMSIHFPASQPPFILAPYHCMTPERPKASTSPVRECVSLVAHYSFPHSTAPQLM